jgi:AcrR family transcriptional regulator
MVEGALTTEQILVAAEDVLRRYGPGKATVVDVARALGVSHASVYRHFPSKAALREAVTRRWLDRAHEPLEAVLGSGGPAPDVLRAWLHTLLDAKRHKALDEPELFATYSVLVVEASDVVERHVRGLTDQLFAILADGVQHGYFADGDLHLKARAVFQATSRFHDPWHAAEWSDPGVDADLDAVCDLLLSGLRAGSDADREAAGQPLR